MYCLMLPLALEGVFSSVARRHASICRNTWPQLTLEGQLTKVHVSIIAYSTMKLDLFPDQHLSELGGCDW